MSFEETAKDCWTIEQYMAAKRENATLKAQVKELREDLETEQRAFEGLNSRFESIKRQRNKLRAENERQDNLLNEVVEVLGIFKAGSGLQCYKGEVLIPIDVALKEALENLEKILQKLKQHKGGV